jgi:hypothetical protein
LKRLLAREDDVGHKALLICLLVAPGPLWAQTERGEQAAMQRDEKAKSPAAPKRGRIEAALVRFEDGRYLERLFAPADGLFARIGGLPEGAGFGVGPGYRRSQVFGGRLDVTASMAISTRGHRGGDLVVAAPRLSRGKLFADVAVRHRDSPQRDFYGLGFDSSRERATSFAFTENAVTATIGARPRPWLSVGTRVGHLSPTVGESRGRRTAPIRTWFVEGQAPGLDTQPTFLSQEAFVTVDTRQPRPNPRSGGRYHAAYTRYQDRAAGAYSFDRLDVDLRQHVAWLHGQRSVAVRAMASVATAGDGREVPFYLQPTLGGSSTLRGFVHDRFRDRNLLLLQAEYRWEVWSFLNAAIFYDAGAVAPDVKTLTLARLRRDYGFGLRFGSERAMLLSTDVAFGSGEGTRILVRFNHAF